MVTRRWTGFQTELMLLAGSQASGVAMVLESDGELYVMES
jgi:hypothetical protein